jgi:poly(ADP-ribose) glycohydrolase ARH3
VNRSYDLRSRYLGSLVGSALGDAIGEMAFRYWSEAELLASLTRTDTLVYTDDTAMALGLAQSIIQVGDLDPQHLGDTFLANYRSEPWRGYASGPPTIFALVERHGLSYVEAAGSLFRGQGSFGNGAAMRIAPLGLAFHDTPDLYEKASASAMVTHTHPIGVDGAAVQARAVAQAVGLDQREPFSTEQFVQGLVDGARTPEMKAKMEMVHSLVEEDMPPAVAADRLGRSVAVHESLPFALYAFLRHPHEFEACLLCAIMHGGDRDTLGAMACAVSGAYLGIEAVPAAWRAKLENLALIEELAMRLWEVRYTAPREAEG